MSGWTRVWPDSRSVFLCSVVHVLLDGSWHSHLLPPENSSRSRHTEFITTNLTEAWHRIFNTKHWRETATGLRWVEFTMNTSKLSSSCWQLEFSFLDFWRSRHTYTHTHILTYTHTHMHTYIHTHTCTRTSTDSHEHAHKRCLLTIRCRCAAVCWRPPQRVVAPLLNVCRWSLLFGT